MKRMEMDGNEHDTIEKKEVEVIEMELEEPDGGRKEKNEIRNGDDSIEKTENEEVRNLHFCNFYHVSL